MITRAATAKAPAAANDPPTAKACPARPARIGPVQPNPARRYPKPKIANPRAGLPLRTLACDRRSGLAKPCHRRKGLGRTPIWTSPRAMRNSPVRSRRIRPAVLMKVTLAKNAPPPTATAAPVRARKTAAPTDKDAAKTAPRCIGLASPPASRPRSVIRSGKAQGEKKDAAPAAADSRRSAQPSTHGS